MKILLLSDSHGHTGNISKALQKNPDVDMIIHLGDYVKDMAGMPDRHKSLRFECVRGNNDWSADIPEERLLEVEGKKLFITHGHSYRIKYNHDLLVSRGKSLGADAVFFGHTHEPEEFFYEGMLVVNPGSIALPRNQSNPSYCVVEVEHSAIRCKFKGVD